jgi:hypothetical protein
MAMGTGTLAGLGHRQEGAHQPVVLHDLDCEDGAESLPEGAYACSQPW